MNKLLWGVQGLLAVAFFMGGGMKVVTPAAELAQQMNWVNHVPVMAVRVIGVLEVLGAIGLILPAALKIKPQLTPMAAAGLVLTMLGAIITHLVLNEPEQIVPGLILGSLASLVAWGRTKKVPLHT
jgi:putative oxidoreductase